MAEAVRRRVGSVGCCGKCRTDRRCRIGSARRFAFTEAGWRVCGLITTRELRSGGGCWNGLKGRCSTEGPL
eukprot:48604-Eustigmatos_ZCMA.PRE.1